LNYIGYVEGRDLNSGEVDVIVCDGFVGNVALKISEGLWETIHAILKWRHRITSGEGGYFLMGGPFAALKRGLTMQKLEGALSLGSTATA